MSTGSSSKKSQSKGQQQNGVVAGMGYRHKEVIMFYAEGNKPGEKEQFKQLTPWGKQDGTESIASRQVLQAIDGKMDDSSIKGKREE